MNAVVLRRDLQAMVCVVFFACFGERVFFDASDLVHGCELSVLIFSGDASLTMHIGAFVRLFFYFLHFRRFFLKSHLWLSFPLTLWGGCKPIDGSITRWTSTHRRIASLGHPFRSCHHSRFHSRFFLPFQLTLLVDYHGECIMGVGIKC